MSYCPTNPAGYFWLSEPSLEPPEPTASGYCPICGARLDLYDPGPLCGTCAIYEEE